MLTLAALAGGLALRVADLGESLWLDELSTLWSTEGSLSEVLDRVPMVMGMSPLYFTVVWAAVQALGEQEWTLRLPSMVSIAVATALVSAAAYGIGRARAAAWAAVLFWWSYPTIWASVDARPYGMAMMFGALLLFGWTRLSIEPTRTARGLWIAGSAGVIWTHYVFAPFVAAAPLAYCLLPDLRERYTPRQFIKDLLILAVLVAPALGQLLQILHTRDAHAWSFESSHLSIPILLAPFLLALVMPAGGQPAGPTPRRALTLTLWLSIGLQWTALEVSALSGSDLLATRYAYVIVISASILAAVRLSRLRGADWVAPVAVFVLGTGLALYATRQIAGSWTGAGYQEWRQAVDTLNRDMRESGEAPVLFRSGNAEDDLSEPGTIRWPATLAPLRHPGQTAPTWTPVLLTYRWHSPARDRYFREELRTLLDQEPTFYLLCLVSDEPDANGYCANVLTWATETWPGQLTISPLGRFSQLVLVRFDRTTG